jgi:hypothetical protein
MALCMSCHGAFHNGVIRYYDLLAIIAKREKTTPDAITQVVHFLRYLPKNPSTRMVEVGMQHWEFSREGLALARKTLEEINGDHD